MTIARTSAPPSRRAPDVLARVCGLTGHPVPTSVSRATDGRLLVIEQLASAGRPTLARDATRLSSLQHPNVARVRQVTTTAALVVVVSDFVTGESLAELERLSIEARGRIPLEVSLRILVDVLNALSSLHGHRDPAVADGTDLAHGHVGATNVIVGLDGVARLVHLLLPTAREVTRGDDGDGAVARADIVAVGVLLERALSAQTEAAAWAAPLASVVKRSSWPVADGGFETAAAMAAEVRLIVKAKLATPAVVGAVVRTLAGDRIEGRARRWMAKRTVSATIRKPAPPVPRPPTVLASTIPEPIAVPVTPPPPEPEPIVPPPAPLAIASTSSGAVEVAIEDEPPLSEPRPVPAATQIPTSSFGAEQRRGRRVVMAVLGVALTILVVAALRTARTTPGDAAANTSPPASAVLPIPQPTVDPPLAAESATAALADPPAAASTPEPETAVHVALPPHADAPTPSAEEKRPAPHHEPAHPVKPASTYDPLGI